MADDLNLAVAFGAETSELDAGTQKAIGDVQAFEKVIADLQKQLETMNRSLVEGFVDVENAIRGPQKEIGETKKEAFGLADGFKQLAAAAVAAFSVKMAVDWVTNTAAMTEEITNLSQRLGIAATDLSAWQVVAGNAGISAGSVTTAVQAMSKQLEAARGGAEEQSEAFRILGVDILTVKDNSELMIQIADAFSTMPDGPEKTAIAMKVLGRSGAELIPLFNKGGDAIVEAMEAAQESGVALSESFIENGLMVDDAIDGIGNAVTALTNNLFEELAPALADIATGIQGWISDMSGAEGAIGPLDAVATTLGLTLKGLGIIIGAVGVIISDVWTAALLVLIPPLALLRALIISISKALQGDFGGAMDAWGDEINNAVTAMGAQVERAKQVRRNFSEFMGEQLGVTDNNKPGGDGGAKATEEGIARLEALKAAQAKAAQARATAERNKAVQEAAAAAREAQRLAREVASYQIAQIERQQDAVEDNYEAWSALENQKLTIIRDVYGEQSRQYEAALAQQAAALRAHNEEVQRLEFLAADNARAIAGIKASGDRDVAVTRLAIERDRIAQMRQMGQINEQQEIAALGALAQREIDMEAQLQTRLFSMEMETLRQSLGALGLKTEERARINAEIERLQAEHNAKMAGLEAQSAANTSATQSQTATSVLESWKRVTQPVGDAVNGMFQNLYNGTMSFKDSLLKGLDQILFGFVNMGIQMAAEWAAMELAKSSATAAGVATRTATEATGAATSQAISAETALFQIANYAWTAAAGAYAALASIPIIGPVLAPAAAIAALGAVLGFAGSIFSAEGGWGQVPQDGMMTKLHENEMVLPAQYATPLREMLTGWAPASTPRQLAQANAEVTADGGRLPGSSYREGDENFTYAPVINTQNQSLKQQLRDQGRQMRGWIKNEKRNRFDSKGND